MNIKCTRIRRLIALMLSVSLIVLLSACRSDGATSNRDESERHPNAITSNKVYIIAYVALKGGLPATVQIDATDTKGGHDTVDDIITTTSRYRKTLLYDSGVRLTVRVEVKPAKPGAGASCSIFDGSQKDIVAPVYDGWRAMCELQTYR